MSNFTPSIRKAPAAAIPQSDNRGVNALHGMSLTEVIAACQWKITDGRGAQRAWTGETFLNLLTPRLFAADAEQQNLYPIPQIYANFDNQEGSVAVEIAQGLSTELLQKGEISQLQYFFKLIDSHTKVTIATDMPAYEDRESEESSELPDFLKADRTSVVTAYEPDPKVCAFLHIYVQKDGRPVRIASSNIEARFAPEVNQVSQLVKAGHHLQAGVVPQAKVRNWLEEQQAPEVPVTKEFSVENFAEVEA